MGKHYLYCKKTKFTEYEEGIIWDSKVKDYVNQSHRHYQAENAQDAYKCCNKFKRNLFSSFYHARSSSLTDCERPDGDYDPVLNESKMYSSGNIYKMDPKHVKDINFSHLAQDHCVTVTAKIPLREMMHCEDMFPKDVKSQLQKCMPVDLSDEDSDGMDIVDGPLIKKKIKQSRKSRRLMEKKVLNSINSVITDRKIKMKSCRNRN